MKKVLSIIILLLMFPIMVNASGGISVSSGTITIEEGKSKTFTITAQNTIGDVDIISNDKSIATVDKSSWSTGMVEEGVTKSGTINVTGSKVGTTTITLKIDAATFDGQDLAGQTKTITVNVIEKAVPVEDNRSKNNNLKEISVEGYNLEAVDKKNYTLTVPLNVEKINIKATAEDEKATVSGTGEHNLNVGENNIEIKVKAENGSKNVITVKVIRKEAYYLADLPEVLTLDSDRVITILDNDVVTLADFKLIKDSGKDVSLIYYDSEGLASYEYIIDGKTLDKYEDFSIKVNFEPLDNEEEATNYASGVYVNIETNGSIPEGITLKIYSTKMIKVDKEESVNLYTYDAKAKKVSLAKEKALVNEDFITFKLNKNSNYFITKSNIQNGKSILSNNTSCNCLTITYLVYILLIVGVIVAAVFIARKIIKDKKNKAEKE